MLNFTFNLVEFHHHARGADHAEVGGGGVGVLGGHQGEDEGGGPLLRDLAILHHQDAVCTIQVPGP